jgi:hypothetical protein
MLAVEHIMKICPLLRRIISEEAGIVDQHIDLYLEALDVGNKGFQGLLVTDVGGQVKNFRKGIFALDIQLEGLQLTLGAGTGDDVKSVRGKLFNDGPTYPFGSAGHEYIFLHIFF